MEKTDEKNQIKETKQKLLLAEAELKNFKKSQSILGILLMTIPLALVFGLLKSMEINSRYGYDEGNEFKYILSVICLIFVIKGAIILNGNAKSNNQRKEDLEKDVLLLKSKLIEDEY